MLAQEIFRKAVENTTLVAYDFIIKNGDDKVLLGMRKNAPAKGFLFVPGGRIFKNEKLNDAFDRILFNETGLVYNDTSQITHLGLFEHIYADNFLNNTNFNTHYIVYALELKLKFTKVINLDEQHSEFGFYAIDDLMENKFVHDNVKSYFGIHPKNKLTLIR